MRGCRYFLIVIQFAFLTCAGAWTAAAQNTNLNPPAISFTVSMSKPWTHLLEVDMRVRQPAGAAAVDLVMPVWTPGSYLIREFERNVQDFNADSGGRPLPWTKINKNTWRVSTAGVREWQVTYRVYANEFSVRTNELNSDHAFWNNAALLMYPEGQIGAPSILRIIPAVNWKIATGLPALPGEKNAFRAENFDILYDSPVEVSDFKEIDFQVRGVPHRVIIDGQGNYDPERMRRDMRRIVETEVALFDEIPYHDYTFILHLRPNTGGGLEHLNSTSLGFRSNGFVNEEGWRGFYGLVAHEFFHLWNVKRIRPDALGPFDYTKENYTKNLWVAEGITDYYGELMPERAGLISGRLYLQQLARRIQAFQNTPGRLEMSAEEASFNAWIKEYRPDENSINSAISYYSKGELLGLLLDLGIRQRTNNGKSLDDVMRYLYTEFFKKGRNYTPADFQKACEYEAGGSLEQFFSEYVRGRAELVPAYNQMLSAAGLHLDQDSEATDESRANGVAEKGFLGADVEQAGDLIRVTTVRSGTPAYDQGLNAKDLIVALDGQHVNKETFQAVIAAHHPGDSIQLTIFRFDVLRTLNLKLGRRNDSVYHITPLPLPNEQQKRIYSSWLGAK